MRLSLWKPFGALALAAAALVPIGAAARGGAEGAPRLDVTVDTDEMRTTPVAYRYIHGTIPDDSKFQLLLPANWNGKLIVHTRGFSGTEFSTGAFQPAALNKGYAFVAGDEGWNRVTIGSQPEDSYYESRKRIVQLTQYARTVIWNYYGRASSRTLIVGGSNGGHHTKWMLEDFPQLFDGGVAGYGYNGQISQWGGVAQVVRNYDILAPRIDDIIARRKAEPDWKPHSEPLTPPLTDAQLTALDNIYSIPATLNLPSGEVFHYNAGRLPGSEATWKQQYPNLVGYLRDSMTTFDPTFNPNGGPLLDSELGLWDPNQSPQWVQRNLRRLDLTGNLTRPVVVMQGTYDSTVSPRENACYKKLVEHVVGAEKARNVLAVYFIPGMGHGGTQFDNLVPTQIDVLEAWIDWQQSGGTAGSLPPDSIGGYPREGETVQCIPQLQ